MYYACAAKNHSPIHLLRFSSLDGQMFCFTLNSIGIKCNYGLQMISLYSTLWAPRSDNLERNIRHTLSPLSLAPCSRKLTWTAMFRLSRPTLGLRSPFSGFQCKSDHVKLCSTQREFLNTYSRNTAFPVSSLVAIQEWNESHSCDDDKHCQMHITPWKRCEELWMII